MANLIEAGIATRRCGGPVVGAHFGGGTWRFLAGGKGSLTIR